VALLMADLFGSVALSFPITWYAQKFPGASSLIIFLEAQRFAHQRGPLFGPNLVEQIVYARHGRELMG
jgi:hypothetical protein